MNNPFVPGASSIAPRRCYSGYRHPVDALAAVLHANSVTLSEGSLPSFRRLPNGRSGRQSFGFDRLGDEAFPDTFRVHEGWFDFAGPERNSGGRLEYQR